MRASAVAERAGIPSVTDLCAHFVKQGQIIAEMEGVPGAPIAVYPDHIGVHSVERRDDYVREQVLPGIDPQGRAREPGVPVRPRAQPGAGARPLAGRIPAEGAAREGAVLRARPHVEERRVEQPRRRAARAAAGARAGVLK